MKTSASRIGIWDVRVSNFFWMKMAMDKSYGLEIDFVVYIVFSGSGRRWIDQRWPSLETYPGGLSWATRIILPRPAWPRLRGNKTSFYSCKARRSDKLCWRHQHLLYIGVIKNYTLIMHVKIVLMTKVWLKNFAYFGCSIMILSLALNPWTPMWKGGKTFKR